MMDVASLKKGPKTTKKHEKIASSKIRCLKGVTMKFSTTHAKRSEQSDSRFP